MVRFAPPSARRAPRRWAGVPIVGALIVGALAFLAAGAEAARADPPLWTAKGPHGAEVDLFGSIHLLSGATRWRNPALAADLAKADQLWFEIPLGADAQAEATRLVQAKGLLPPGETLASVLPPALAARAAAFATREGLPAAALQRMKPWLAELELTLLFYQKRGYREDLGVERQVDASAPASARREAFETLAEQVDLFADAPIPEQVASLKETLDEIDADPGVFDRMADAWRRGDVGALAAEVVDRTHDDDPALYRRILADRNRRFADRIEILLRQGPGRALVVVGAGHLLGPDGVPALLRRDGFAVDGP